MVMKDSIFREYDIRGVVGRDFDAQFAKALGQAFGVLLSRELQREPGDLQIAVGRDCRLSGEELATALIEGVRSTGVSVVSSGMGPTPQLYFTVFARELDGGIQVTGSHNPGDQNGFKMMFGRQTLSGDAIQRLRNAIVEGVGQNSGSTAKGELQEWDGRKHYLADLIARSRPHMGSKKLKVVVDGGNGVGGMIGPDLLRDLGCEVIELFTEPDGRFPNHHPDPTVMENIVDLRATVRAQGADIGIAWDGDADRIGVVDENADVIFGDILLLLYGKQLLKEIEAPIVIGDVKCSQVLFDELARLGAKPVMWKTGHSLIKSKLKELNAHLAGEMSGHIFFAHRYYGFDDALHAAARLVEMLSSSSQSLSEMLKDVPSMVSTPEIRVDCPEHIKFRVADAARERFKEFEISTLDGVRIMFPNGWGLVRASNTQPALVMRFEADSEARLREYRALVEGRITALMSELEGN